MTVIIVQSAPLSTVAYDAPHEILRIEFRDRSVYQYFGVPASVYEALLQAPSKGAYFNRAIRGCFPYVRSLLS